MHFLQFLRLRKRKCWRGGILTKILGCSIIISAEAKRRENSKFEIRNSEFGIDWNRASRRFVEAKVEAKRRENLKFGIQNSELTKIKLTAFLSRRRCRSEEAMRCFKAEAKGLGKGAMHSFSAEKKAKVRR